MGKRSRRARRRSEDQDEPIPEGDEWVEYGGELIGAAGCSEGGLPYGVTLDERRLEMRSEAPTPGWVRARDVRETLVRRQSPGGARIELGRVTHVGEGLFRRAYAAQVAVVPDANSLTGAWMVLLPPGEIDDDQRFGSSANLRIHARARDGRRIHCS